MPHFSPFSHTIKCSIHTKCFFLVVRFLLHSHSGSTFHFLPSSLDFLFNKTKTVVCMDQIYHYYDYFCMFLIIFLLLFLCSLYSVLYSNSRYQANDDIAIKYERVSTFIDEKYFNITKTFSIQIYDRKIIKNVSRTKSRLIYLKIKQ